MFSALSTKCGIKVRDRYKIAHLTLFLQGSHLNKGKISFPLVNSNRNSINKYKEELRGN